MQIEWVDFKSIINDNNLNFVITTEIVGKIEVKTRFGTTDVYCIIHQEADVVEFDASYRALAGGVLFDSELKKQLSPLTVNRYVTGTITQACSDANINSCPPEAAVQINAEGMGTVICQHNGGWAGVVVFDVSYDYGVTWEMQSSIDISVNSISDNNRYFIKWGSNRTADRWAINCSGATLVRLRAPILSSGSIPVILTATPPVFYTNPVERRNNTYSAGILSFTTVNGATDIACLKGNDTKVIKVFAVGYSATQQNVSFENITLVKRSTDNTGGTRTQMTAVPYDSQDGASSGQAFYYTANPTALGTEVGRIRPSRIIVPGQNPGTSATAQCEKVWLFDANQGKKPLYLRGSNEMLCINQNGATFSGNITSIYFEWTEE